MSNSLNFLICKLFHEWSVRNNYLYHIKYLYHSKPEWIVRYEKTLLYVAVTLNIIPLIFDIDMQSYFFVVTSVC